MFVAASTLCWPDLELQAAIELLQDLEFTAVEIAVQESVGPIRPDELLEDEDRAVQILRSSHRMDISGYRLELASTGEQHYEQFHAMCRIAKATKVVNISVPSAEKGTPFNEEVEHLRKLVAIAEGEGVRLSVRCMLGCLSEDPDTLLVLCNNVDGLGVALDPSVSMVAAGDNPAIAKAMAVGKGFDQLLKFVTNVQLRDTRKDQFQVSVGQGEIDYGKIVTQLEREKYKRALTVDMVPMDDFDHRIELRKLRRLLESLI
ncbi:sugar phosphate isomerase/epimerase family protein [Neorhodopirellula pilleata]|uniref:Xylose isomerase-like TIM barrel n=1 Tax=Neorhodopirellula pilleata TaxID=2714738 RepID=A0A5C6A8P0_9BACT|nr:TIM barrel protein [Neorhodopirellula pilleata]TWT96372.1 Xylose isomerase-like TIM barrel [Neorhodopirellula pilleata]